MTRDDCITLDYLEIFCLRNHLVVGCRSGDEEIWVSEMGAEPSELSSSDVERILRDCSVFELRNRFDEDELVEQSFLLDRGEMELRLSRLLN